MLSLEESLKILKETNALLEGHFILSSGLHSPQYIQCAQLMSKPDKAIRLCESLSEKIKTDFAGEKEWSKVYGGKLDDFGWGATESVDGGYVITGETFSFGNGQSDIYIFKIDSVGNKVWSNTFGGLSEDVGYSIVNSDDGGYAVSYTHLRAHET